MENDKNTKALKAGVWYTVSSISVKTIAIITTPIFVRMMTTTDYGIANNFSAWYTLLMIFCSLNLTYSIGRAKIDFPGRLREYVGSVRLLSALTTLIIGSIAMVFIEPVSEFMELTPTLLVIMFVYILFAPGMTFTSSFFRYEYRYKENIALSVYTCVATVIVTFIMLAVFREDKYYAKVLGSVIPTVLISFVFWVLAFAQKSVKVNLEYWKYGLQISLPLIIHSVSLNILSLSDRIMITKFRNAEETAIYSLSYSYAILINVILSAVNEAWLPWFHDSYHAEEFGEIRKNVKPFVILGCMLGIGCIAIAPEAMCVMGPPEYREGQWAVAPVAIGLICQFIYQQYVHIELHLKKTSYISVGTVIAAIMNLILNAIMIPRYGFIAAACATMICYFALMFIHLFITRVIMKIHLYDDKFMFIAMFVVCSIAGGFMLLYNQVAIRYVLLVVICGVYLVLSKDFLLKLIKKRR